MALVSFRMCVGSAAGPQTLTIVTTNPDFIGEAEQALASGKTRVPIFDLLDGTGADPQWTWQVNPSTPTFADATVELCDGCPADVEANKAYWLSSVKRFCPWSAEVTRVEPIDSTG
jgi:hypothetical protein